MFEFVEFPHEFIDVHLGKYYATCYELKEHLIISLMSFSHILLEQYFLWILAKTHQAYKHTFHAYVRILLVITQCTIIMNGEHFYNQVAHKLVKMGRSTLETVKGVLHSTDYAHSLIM